MQSVNVIEIWEPRWKDRVVLVANWKIGAVNKLVITKKHADGSPYFPEPFMLTGDFLKAYPMTAVKGKHAFRAVALDDLLKLEEVTQGGDV